MLVSMTGFGKAEEKTAFGELQIEIQSINSRSLLIKTNLPKSFTPFDLSVKKAVSENVERGTIFVNVTLHSISDQSTKIKANIDLAKSYKKQLNKLSKELKLALRDEDAMAFLLRQGGLFELSDKVKGVEKPLLAAVKKALQKLINTKKQEGQLLAKDIEKRLKTIQKCAYELKKFEKRQPKKVAAKLASTLKEIKQNPEEERFLKEIALVADKANITEEVTRIKSHIKQMLHMITKPTGASGKKMEFFTSELFRETNTISQKALFQEMIQLSIEMKTQIEKIKEQLANVE